MLSIEKVSKSYAGNVAVDDISFEVPEGRIFGLLGANGAGKTTTVRMILDIVRPVEGRITWRGEPVGGISKKSFGYLPEERGLYTDMKVGEQLVFFARLRGLLRTEAEKSAGSWLERFGVSEYRDRFLRELSKGNQQKIQFISAILHEPEFLILDEPFSGLDPVNNELLKGVIVELKERGTTLLLSTHDMERAEELCESVALLHRSELTFAGPLKELRERHAHERKLRLSFEGDAASLLERFPKLEVLEEQPEYLELSPNGVEPEEVLKEAVGIGKVRRFEEVEPSLRRIFIREVGARG